MKTFAKSLDAPGTSDAQVRAEIEKLLKEVPYEDQKQIVQAAIELLKG